MSEEIHIMIHKILNELKIHKSDYISIFGSAKRFKYILNGLRHPQNSSGIALQDNWLTLSNMGHIVAICYNKVIVELTKHANGISKSFFFQSEVVHHLT